MIIITKTITHNKIVYDIIRIIIIHGENEHNYISGPGNTIPFTFSFDKHLSLSKRAQLEELRRRNGLRSGSIVLTDHRRTGRELPPKKVTWDSNGTLGIQSPCQMMIGVYNHLLSKVFRFHYHSQKVIGSLGAIQLVTRKLAFSPLDNEGWNGRWFISFWIGLFSRDMNLNFAGYGLE